MPLNNEQNQAVTTQEKRLLVLAGAGSGKTRVITERINYFIHHLEIPAHQILALTFTNKAAKEMHERATKLSYQAQKSYFTTFHSFGARFLRDYGHYIGLLRYFTIYDDQDQMGHLKRLYPNEPQNQLHQWRHYINRAKDYALNLEELDQIYPNMREFQRIFQSYQATLLANQAVDFGDLILLPLQILEQESLFKESIQKQWQAILVDEYQDTNQAQAILLQHLHNKDQFLTVVGDEDQSIYAFRGANSQAILQFDRYFPGTKIIKLEENYRSQPHILASANQLIAHNAHRLGKHLYTQQPAGELVEIHHFTNEEEEVRWICSFLSDNQDPNHSYAILYRTNAQSRLFEKIFTQASLSYKLVGSIRFFEREEVKSVLAALTLLLNPLDHNAFSRILTTPTRGIGAKTLQNIYHKQQELNNHEENLFSIAQQVKLSSKAKSAIQELKEYYAYFEHQLTSKISLQDIYLDMIQKLGLLNHYTHKDSLEGSDRIDNLYELTNALSYYPPGKEGLAQFIESVQLNISQEQEDGHSTSIHLITIHNTKGLEYDTVFVTGMEQQLFPKIDLHSMHHDEEMEEERRLCYVALTRAKKQLHVSFAQTRRVFGKLHYQQPSQFLYELASNQHTRNVSHLAILEDSHSRRHQTSSLFNVGGWVNDQEFGVGKITKMNNSKAGHLVLEIRFKDGVRKFLPQFRYLESIIIENEPF